jgi:hypothetical protein
VLSVAAVVKRRTPRDHCLPPNHQLPSAISLRLGQPASKKLELSPCGAKMAAFTPVNHMAMRYAFHSAEMHVRSCFADRRA